MLKMMKLIEFFRILCWLIWFTSEAEVSGQLLTGNWTWLSGGNTGNQVGIYGTQGLADVNNRPGSRQSHSMVMHQSGQLIFVFGGLGHDTGNLGK